MEPFRLTPAVILPDRRGRRLAVGAALALMVAGGASTYVGSVYPPRAAPVADAQARGFYAGMPSEPTVHVRFESDPPSVNVIQDGATICRTPCDWIATATAPFAVFTLERPGFERRELVVGLDGGDTLVRASLVPVNIPE